VGAEGARTGADLGGGSLKGGPPRTLIFHQGGGGGVALGIVVADVELLRARHDGGDRIDNGLCGGAIAETVRAIAE